MKKKKFDISTSRRGFAIIRLQEEKLYENFIQYAQRLYPDKEFLIQSALNKYNKYETVPEYHKIILIDGIMLVNLMYKYGVGVQTKSNYEVKIVDSDFFEIDDI